MVSLPLRMRSSSNLNVNHPDPGVGGGADGGADGGGHKTADADVPLARETAKLLLLKVINSENMGALVNAETRLTLR